MSKISAAPDHLRYARQLLVEQIGPSGQEKLATARVLIVGCGALGTMQALLLSRAGVHDLRLVDDDKVELGNLHRQMLFDEVDVAACKPKVVALAQHLSQADSSTKIQTFMMRFSPSTASELLRDIDIVLDATDNFESRFDINQCCLDASVPWIYGGAVASTGMMMPVYPDRGPCLRCLMPALPKHSANAAELGVLNTLTTTIAAWQAQAALRHVLGKPLPAGKLWRWDGWELGLQKVKVSKRNDCPACSGHND